MKPVNVCARIDWIKEWMSDHDGHVDILDVEFVDAYVGKFNAPVKIQFLGANSCKELGRVLANGYHQGIFDRWTIGIPWHESGFPNWVYTYSLKVDKNESQK
jgi:hypothetical protein